VHITGSAVLSSAAVVAVPVSGVGVIAGTRTARTVPGARHVIAHHDYHGGAHMSTQTVPATLAPQVATRVQTYIDEALEGPEKGGIAGNIRISDTDIEVLASRGWGVSFTRKLPSGVRSSTHLTVHQLDQDTVGAAVSSLLLMS
jgi:hypothetical protein